MSDNILNMSDEDFMKNYGQGEGIINNDSQEPDNAKEPEPQTDSGQTSDQKIDEPQNDSNQTEPPAEPVTDNTDSNSDDNNQGDSSSGSDNKTTEPVTDNNDIKSNNKTNKNNSDTIDSNNDIEPDYKALYQKIMAPFKADGKLIQLKDVNEAITLMQKGVNYTRKMQNLAKYQKPVLSLEKANLLDTAKLNTLINIYNGDKEAIKQLLAERKIDPMDLSYDGYNNDDNSHTNYIPNNNMVDDSYVNFRNAVDDVKDTPEGQAVIADLLNSDDRTKAEVFQDPRLIGLLVQQKASGLYDQVMNEVHRKRAIGLLDNSVPLIYAYNQVGNEMNAQLSRKQGKNINAAGSIKSSGSAMNAMSQNPVRRTTQPKQSFTNNARARAAATNRTSPTTDKQIRNPLSMSDEEFLKTFGGRY